MRQFLEFVLAHRVAVVLLAALLFTAGVWKLSGAPLEVFPDFAPPSITVQTEAPGFDVEQVEQLVTVVIEQAVNGAVGLDTIRSESIPGLSVVTLTFKAGTDPYRVRQAVTENLTSAQALLPPGIGPPKASPLTSATMDVLKVGLVSDRVSPAELRSFADNILKPALLSVAGVARVNVFGGDRAEVQVKLDPERLKQFKVGVDATLLAAQRGLTVQAGGYVETDAQRFALQLPLPSRLAALAATPIETRGGQTIRLGDVGTVTMGAAPAFGDAIIQGQPGVLLTLSGQYGANTLAVTRQLDARLQGFAPRLAAAGIELYPALHRPATFVQTALGNLRDALLLGALFVAVVLIAFLRDWRAAVISFVAIPVSLVIAALTLWALGYAIDTLVLGGFAVALGVLVDDAIVDVENVMRRLRDCRDDPAHHPDKLAIVLDASIEIRSAMVYATVVVLLVFVPVLLQSGVEGAFLTPLALAFMVSVVASLLVALTLTPALGALLLADRHQPDEPRWIKRLEAWQGRMIARLGKYRRAGLALTAAVFIVLVALATHQPVEFLPMFREGHFVAQANFAQPGVSLGEAQRSGRAISAALLKLPFVATVEQQLGRAEAGEDTWPVDKSEFHIELKPDPSIDQEAAQDRIRAVFAGFPGIETEVQTFLGDRLGESLTGETAQVTASLYGDDLATLGRAAGQAAAAFATVRGAVDIHTDADAGVPALTVAIDPTRAADLGIDPATLPTLIRAATQGLPAGNLYRGAVAVPVTLRLDAPAAGIGAGLTGLLVDSPVAGLVPVSSFAQLLPGDTRPAIRRDGGRRVAVIGFNIEGRGADATIADARAALKRAGLPKDVDVVFGGVGAAARSAAIGLAAAAAATLVLIVLTLRGAFIDPRNAWLVLLNLPFALIGALAALLAFGLPLTLGAAVGLITVFGISARNAILLLSHYERLSDGGTLTEALAVEGAMHRFVPIVMTALVAALGLLPLAAGLGRAGHEIEAPLAIVVLGGLASSTLLSLLFLPALSWQPQRSRVQPYSGEKLAD